MIFYEKADFMLVKLQQANMLQLTMHDRYFATVMEHDNEAHVNMIFLASF
jgi:hypothetical protein